MITSDGKPTVQTEIRNLAQGRLVWFSLQSGGDGISGLEEISEEAVEAAARAAGVSTLTKACDEIITQLRGKGIKPGIWAAAYRFKDQRDQRREAGEDPVATFKSRSIIGRSRAGQTQESPAGKTSAQTKLPARNIQANVSGERRESVPWLQHRSPSRPVNLNTQPASNRRSGFDAAYDAFLTKYRSASMNDRIRMLRAPENRRFKVRLSREE